MESCAGFEAPTCSRLEARNRLLHLVLTFRVGTAFMVVMMVVLMVRGARAAVSYIAKRWISAVRGVRGARS